MFRSPMQRFAARLHRAGYETNSPFSENGMALAILLNLGVAGGTLVALLLASVGGWPSVIAAIAIAVLLSVALFHHIFRWVSIALGTALATSLGVALGALEHAGMTGIACGGAVGLLVAGITYGPVVLAALRAKA